MSVVLEISLPVFGLILCGYVAGITGILGKQSAAALNGFVFYFALPALLFGFTALAPLIVILNWNFIGSIFFGSLATYIVALIIGWSVFGFRLPIIGIAALSSVFANTGYLGIPLFLTAFGPDQAGPAIVATVTVNIVFVGGTICFLELAGNNKTTPTVTIINVFRALAKNPLISAPVLALPFTIFGIQLPVFASRFLDLLGSAAAPAALFAIGMSFVERTVKSRQREIGVFVLIKMLVHPFLTWVMVTYFFELESFWASSAILLSALPTAAMAFVIAQEKGAYVGEVSSTIVLTTIISVVTISALLVILPN